jgi:hypothetical protein
MHTNKPVKLELFSFIIIFFSRDGERGGDNVKYDHIDSKRILN